MSIKWQVFEWMADQVEKPLGQTVSQLASQVQGDLRSPMTAAAVLYIVLIGLLVLSGKYAEAGPSLVGRMMRLAFIVWLSTSAAAYQTWVIGFFFETLPNAVTHAVGTGQGSGSAEIDNAWLQAWETALSMWQNADKADMGFSLTAADSWGHAIVGNILIVLFLFAALAFCTLCFLVWLASRFLLGMGLIFGPIMIAMALFPATKAVFEKWVGNLINQILLQGAVVVMLSIMFKAEGMILAELGAPESNFWGALQQLFAGIMFFCVGGFIAFQLTSWAAAHAGGLAFQYAGLAQQAFSALTDQGKGRDGKDGGDKGGGGKVSNGGGGGGSIGRQAGESVGDAPGLPAPAIEGSYRVIGSSPSASIGD